jgi:hypothetical protein
MSETNPDPSEPQHDSAHLVPPGTARLVIRGYLLAVPVVAIIGVFVQGWARVVVLALLAILLGLLAIVLHKRGRMTSE